MTVAQLLQRIGSASGDVQKVLDACRSFLRANGSIHCHDCCKYNDGYMVKRSIRQMAGGEKGMLICLRCLEKRLGRHLTIDDFVKGLPANDVVLWAYQRFGGKQ